jgi:hypothetical protein
MSFEIVNCYVCRDCSETALAQRGIDPTHPPNKVDPSHDADNGREETEERMLAPPADGRGAVVDILA